MVATVVFVAALSSIVSMLIDAFTLYLKRRAEEARPDPRIEGLRKSHEKLAELYLWHLYQSH